MVGGIWTYKTLSFKGFRGEGTGRKTMALEEFKDCLRGEVFFVLASDWYPHPKAEAQATVS